VCAFALHRLNRVQGSEASRHAAAELLDERRARSPTSCCRRRRPRRPAARRRADRVPARRAVERAGAAAGTPGVGQPVAQRVVGGGRRRRPGRPGGPAAAFVAGPGLRSPTRRSPRWRGYTQAPSSSAGRSTADGTIDLFGGRGWSTSPATARSAPTTRCSRRWRWPTGRSPCTTSSGRRDAGGRRAVGVQRGTSAAINGGTLLGLSSALGAFGASDVIAPLTPVNDEHVQAVMLRLHTALAAGEAPAAALAAATASGDDLDPVGAAPSSPSACDPSGGGRNCLTDR
jgi:hypothetical protein